MRRRITGACVVQCVISVLAVVALTGRPAVAEAAPSNDAFAKAQELSGLDGTVAGSTAGATREPAEPEHAADLGEAGDASVWYTWIAPAEANVDFTLTATFRSVLAAYSGDELGTLERVPAPIAEGRVSFLARAGVPYRIAVAGLKGESGSFTLDWSATAVPPPPPPPAAPVNDNLADALAITGREGSVHGSNVAATLEAGEPDHSGQQPPVNGASVWWSWQAPATGELTFSTEGSGFDTILAVFDGPSFDAVVTVNDDAPGGLTSAVSFLAEAGRIYYVQVLGWRASTGSVSLSWQTSGPPANNDLAGAQPIEGLAGTSAGSTREATAEDGEPQHAGVGAGQSVWWRWTAPAGARVTFSTEASPSLTVLAVYTGTSYADLSLVGANADAIPGVVEGARVAFQAQPETQYLVAVDTEHATNDGPVVLRWDPAPPNDQFADAAVLPASDGSVTGTLVGGSREPGEPRHGLGTGGASTVWYRWTAPHDGVFRFTTTGSQRNVVLSAYTGGSVEVLVEVAGDSASQQNFPFQPDVSVMTLPAGAGTTYAIAAADDCGGFCRGYGALRLDWTFVPPPANDRFTTATAISGPSGRVLADNVGATKEAGEPDHAGEPGGGSVWYRWTAPHSGRFTFDALRSHGSHSVLDVYTGESIETLTAVPRAGIASLLVSESPSDPLSARRGFAGFDAVVGSTYWIAVDTRDTTLFPSRRNDILVAWDPAPANDDLAGAIPLVAADVPVAGTTDGASVAEGEARGVHASVWYRWVAPHDGVFRFHAGAADWTPLVHVFRDDAGDVLQPVEPREFTPDDTFVLGASGGEQFAVSVASRHFYGFGLVFGGTVAGPFQLTWTELPVNDHFADALPLSGTEGSVAGVTVGATREPGENEHYGQPDGASVWYRWTAPADGAVQFTVDADFDAFIGVFEGAHISALKFVERVFDFTDPERSVVFAAVAGRDYYVLVDGFGGATGRFTVAWQPRLVPRYFFDGFHPPVANEPEVNRVEAGRAIPVKFRLFDEQGPVGDISAVREVSTTAVTCPDSPGEPMPPSAEEAQANSGLRYDEAEEQYVFGWKTSPDLADSCRRLDVHLDDGQTFSALFDFR